MVCGYDETSQLRTIAKAMIYLRSGVNTMLCCVAQTPPPAKRRHLEVDMDVLRQLGPGELCRLDYSRRNRRVYKAARRRPWSKVPGVAVLVVNCCSVLIPMLKDGSSPAQG